MQFPQSNKFIMVVNVKATCESKLNDSPGTVEYWEQKNHILKKIINNESLFKCI